MLKRKPFRFPKRLKICAVYSVEEETFLEALKPWTKVHWNEAKENGAATNNSIRIIKDKIKMEYTINQKNYCAYCGLKLSLCDEIHREHIVSQKENSEFIFIAQNLVLSCDICNMAKKTKYVLVDKNIASYTECDFKILNPYLDDFRTYFNTDFFDQSNGAKKLFVFNIIVADQNSIGYKKAKKTSEVFGFIEPKHARRRGRILFSEANEATDAQIENVKQITINPRFART